VRSKQAQLLREWSGAGDGADELKKEMGLFARDLFVEHPKLLIVHAAPLANQQKGAKVSTLKKNKKEEGKKKEIRMDRKIVSTSISSSSAVIEQDRVKDGKLSSCNCLFLSNNNFNTIGKAISDSLPPQYRDQCSLIVVDDPREVHRICTQRFPLSTSL
jgi:hypothetical protein